MDIVSRRTTGEILFDRSWTATCDGMCLGTPKKGCRVEKIYASKTGGTGTFVAIGKDGDGFRTTVIEGVWNHAKKEGDNWIFYKNQVGHAGSCFTGCPALDEFFANYKEFVK